MRVAWLQELQEVWSKEYVTSGLVACTIVIYMSVRRDGSVRWVWGCLLYTIPYRTGEGSRSALEDIEQGKGFQLSSFAGQCYISKWRRQVWILNLVTTT